MKPLSIHWDYYDQVYEYGRVYGRDAMHHLYESAQAVGVGSLNFRVEGAGMSWVPTTCRPAFDQYTPEKAVDFADFSRLSVAKESHQRRREVADIFKQTYAQIGNPLEVACEVARQDGMPLNIYICPYDQYFPGLNDSIVHQHPDRCITSRDGKQRLAVPSLAYPENRLWLLNYYREIFQHDFADAIVYPNSHAWYSYPIDGPDDWFGFEQPAVQDYLERTGIDVRRDPFDINDYYKHYGTYWTMLLRELATMQQRRGHRLIVGMDMGPWQVYLPWGAGKVMTTWRHHNDWQTWTSWKNVDLCVGHQVNMWEYDMWPGNRLPYMPGEPDKPPYRFAREFFGDRNDADYDVYSFLTLHADRAATELPMAAKGTHDEGYDGLIVREAADFEFKLNWQCLRGLMD